MQKILLDTNFILTCMKQKIDILKEFEELFGFYQILIPMQVLDELDKLTRSKKLKIRERQAAEVSLELIKKLEPEILHFEEKNVDEAIIDYLNKKNDIVLATLDRELKKRIKNKKIKFLTIKRKKKVGFA